MSSILYIDPPIVTDPDALAAAAFAFIQAVYPNWVPNAGNLDTIILEASAQMAAEAATVASAVPASIFRYFGQLVRITPINATPATVTATFTMIDNQGYTIPAGTLVGIPGPGGALVSFAVGAAVTVPAGQTQTASGGVTLVAVNAGSSGSGLTGTPQLITTLAFITSISLTAVTTGGLDAETDAAYLNRLATELQLLTPRPILPQDFADLAQNTNGVARALALDGYSPAVDEVQTITLANATGGTFTITFGGNTTAGIAWNATPTAVQAALTALASIGGAGVSVTGGPLMTAPVTVTFVGSNAGVSEALMTTTASGLTGSSPTATVARVTAGAAATTGNERTETVAMVDANGNPVSAAIKSSVQTYLQALREINWLIYTTDPTITQIDVTFTVAVVGGYDPVGTVAAATAALTGFLNPAIWGTTPGDQNTWVNTPTVRLLDLASVLKNTPGVAYITLLELCVHGGTLGTADVSLPGAAPLAQAGTITGSHT